MPLLMPLLLIVYADAHIFIDSADASDDIAADAYARDDDDVACFDFFMPRQFCRRFAAATCRLVSRRRVALPLLGLLMFH